MTLRDSPYVVEDTAIPTLPELIAEGVTPVYRLGPDCVFDEAEGILVPIPLGEDADSLDIYYYSESDRHPGWYNGENVQGWIVPGSVSVVEQGGQSSLYFEVNHSGVFQLARTTSVKLGSLASVDVGAEGSPLRWLAAAAVLITLATGGLRDMRKKREPNLL